MNWCIDRRRLFHCLRLLIFAALLSQSFPAQNSADSFSDSLLPKAPGSVRIAVIGDSGRGSTKQRELADVMVRYHDIFGFESVLMTGDNIYYGDDPEDFRKKFEEPYQRLLSRGVKFYAALGNHDSPSQVNYALFNMGGRHFYRFAERAVSFYALNSTQVDGVQIEWLTSELAVDPNRWRVAFLHHPLYSSGRRHGSDAEVRGVLEPIFLRGGVDVVFAGHDHFYERIVPQRGISYFVSGAAGKIRKGNIEKGSPLTAKGFDTDLSFMLVEVAGDEMHFQVIARDGKTVDHGVIRRRD